MADVTGPIHTLPGALHATPEGAMCDDHPDRPATHRVQGETDSMGCELHDLCDECYAEWRARGIYKPDRCDWCKEKADDCRPTRDYEEGMRGPVYYVCGACRKRRDEREEEELRESGFYDNDCWDEPDDDTYEAEAAEIEDEDYEPRVPEGMRPLPSAVNCKRCGKPWKPGHSCRGARAARAALRRTA